MRSQTSKETSPTWDFEVLFYRRDPESEVRIEVRLSIRHLTVGTSARTRIPSHKLHSVPTRRRLSDVSQLSSRVVFACGT